MDSATQVEHGFLLHHFCGGTPNRGGWEYQPTPVGLKIITAGKWKGAEKGKERHGRRSQTILKGKRKHKGVQTMDVDEEERKKWEEERRATEEFNLVKIDVEESRSNRDRYREWIIRSRIRMRKEEDEELIEAVNELRGWVEKKEREFKAAEVLGGMLDQIEINEMIKGLTPPPMITPIEDTRREMEVEGELLGDISKENVPPPTPKSQLKIRAIEVFGRPSPLIRYATINGRRQIIVNNL